MPVETSSASNPKPNGPSAGDPLRQAVNEQASAIWDDAKGTARTKLDEQKQSVASGIGSIADALRTSARDLEQKQQGPIARFAEGAADSLQQLSGRLEGRDLDGLMRDAETMARRRPAVFFCSAMAAGFLAVRFMKSSQSSHP